MSTELSPLDPTSNELVKILNMVEMTPREKITLIERVNAESNQIDCPHTRRMIANGVYYGEQVIPQGTVITGAVHKFEHFFMLLKGRMTLYCEDGLSYHEAPEIFVSRAGMKRIGYAHDDCIVANIERVQDGMPCEPDQLWEHLYIGTFEEYEQYLNAMGETSCH